MKFVDIHTHAYVKNEDIVQVINVYPGSTVPSSIYSSGIHPWFVEIENIDADLNFLNQSLNDENCIAIGECGLDKEIDTNFVLQKEVLVQQLDLNNNFKKPVIIHCVKAFQEIIKIKTSYDFDFIIHGYTKKLILAEQLLSKGFYLSFGKALFENIKLQQVFKQLPLENIFLETDDDEVSIKDIYIKAAFVRGISIEELILNIEKNYKKVFQ